MFVAMQLINMYIDQYVCKRVDICIYISCMYAARLINKFTVHSLVKENLPALSCFARQFVTYFAHNEIANNI